MRLHQIEINQIRQLFLAYLIANLSKGALPFDSRPFMHGCYFGIPDSRPAVYFVINIPTHEYMVKYSRHMYEIVCRIRHGREMWSIYSIARNINLQTCPHELFICRGRRVHLTRPARSSILFSSDIQMFSDRYIRVY